MAPFKPKGDRSMRVIVADLVARSAPGDMISFEILGRALDLGPETHRDQIRQAVSAARPVVLKDYKRALIAVRGEGYRVAKANEFAGLAQDHRRKADHQMGKALAIVKNVDERELTSAELNRHRAVEYIIVRLHDRLSDAEDRLTTLEDAVFGRQPGTVYTADRSGTIYVDSEQVPFGEA